MTGAGGLPPHTGRLLVATADLLDPNFAGAVVLLLDHDDEGTLGVVLNRPTEVPVAGVLADWASYADAPPVLFEGGPVSPDAALAVAGLTPTAEPREPVDPVGFRRLFDDVGVVDLDTPREIVTEGLVHLRVFAGYAGWGAEQLQAEVDEGAWIVVDAQLEDLFGADPGSLRTRVLRRQPGSLAWTSTQPADPTLN